MENDALKKLISKDPSLCNSWAGGMCYYPNGFRNCKMSETEQKKLPDCMCKPGNEKIFCDKCTPDEGLLESRPKLFDVSTINGK